ALERPELSYTFSIVRESAPNIFVMGNIGAAQFSLKYGLDEAFKAVEMVDADALAVHLNPLQEAVQPEGEPFYDGVLEKLKLLSSSLKLPIIAKETGSGISGEVAAKLEKVGISGVDVGGAGGTSWAAVEYYRSLEAGDLSHASLAELFWDWGIPTAISICEVSFHTNLPIIATGGVRSGIDIAKALALGASLAGIALPLLKPAVENGVKGVLSYLERLINELKVAMFLVGARRIADLKRIPLIIGGFTGNWLKLRGISLEEYARRGGKL
ncbi:MAG TPA: type 2 isopentenyl-diphosphate Delta-isomerase, partial [Candidatus Bathyarchaeota archaeon]|nr:type 2 isopentenyl-diphosphate Delta-isomerase [Candidatus Bathyarchaeota archaeon]